MKSTLEANDTIEVDIVVVVVGSLDQAFDILVGSIVVVGSIVYFLFTFSATIFQKTLSSGNFKLF